MQSILRLLRNIITFVAIVGCLLQQHIVYGSSNGAGSISNLSVTLRGQKYEIENVSTVQDVQEQISTLSGIAIPQQGRVIYGGTKLSSDTILSTIPGLEDGAHLNIVPSTSTKKKKKSTTTSAAAASGSTTTSSTTTATAAAAATNPMSDLLKNSGIDTKDIDEMMKSMGMGGTGENGMPKSLEESMKGMQEMMKSPLIQQMLSDPEKLEQTRQMILNNPMLMNMMTSIPGMKDMIQDADTWKQSMLMAAELYKNMDSNTLMQAMMGGAQSAMMNHEQQQQSLSGSSDTMSSTASTVSSVLDELDEDE